MGTSAPATTSRRTRPTTVAATITTAMIPAPIAGRLLKRTPQIMADV
ncbi:MAG: hypothetical protein ACKO91_06265 [Acidimicrobiales bacterium]